MTGIGQSSAYPTSDEIDEAFERYEDKGSHECTVCGSMKDVNDYQKETPSWCDDCGGVKTFRKVDEEQ